MLKATFLAADSLVADSLEANILEAIALNQISLGPVPYLFELKRKYAAIDFKKSSSWGETLGNTGGDCVVLQQ